MIIFSSSTAGSDRSSLENKAAKMSKGRIKIINLVDKIVEEANKANPYITNSNLLNLDIDKIRHLKDDAISKIVQITKNSKNDYIIDGRMSFWWRSGPVMLLELEDIRRLNPEFIISVVSGPKDVVRNLKKKKSWVDKEIDEYEMAEWSEVEVYTSDLFSQIIKKKNYVIGAAEDPKTLYDLIYHGEKPKAYLSFSMAHRKKDYKKLGSFLSRLRKYLVVFDPRSVSISEYRDEDERLREKVYNQTVRRDFHFIDQSDLVIVYLNELVYSSGVDSERMHAYSTGRRVLLYFPFEGPSPFTPYFVDKLFKSEGELVNEIKRLYAKGLAKRKAARF